MSTFFYIGAGTSFEEKRTWISEVISTVAYATYAAIILGRAETAALTAMSYVSTMLWTIGASIAVSIVLNILVAMASPKDANKKDLRDKEINRRGDAIGLSFVLVGGVTAMGTTMAKIVAHRRGFQSW
jgi:hypothetical protein